MSEKEINPKYAERQRKPSGWKGPRGSTFWTKSTKYGMEYKCPHCGRVTRGLGIARARMHFPGCPNVDADPWIAWRNHK